MPEMETTVTQKGQVTIPAEVRRAMGLKPRDKVIFRLVGKVAEMKKAPSKVLAGFGAVTPRKKPEDWQEVREEFEKGVAEEAAEEG